MSLLNPRYAMRSVINRIIPQPPPIDSAHRPSLGWTAARVALSMSKNHAFLDRPSIPLLFRLTPKSLRKGLGLHTLSLSPHYWIYQYNDDIYPKWYTRRQILDAE